MKTLEKKDLEMRLVCSTIAVSYINNLGYFSLFSVFFYFLKDIAVLKSGPKLISCHEDDEFMAAFDKMMTEVCTDNYYYNY